MITLEFAYKIKVPRNYERLFKKAALSASKRKLLKKTMKITVVFIGLAEMKRLNFSYRGQNKPTNVLSFPQLNEIFISPQIASKEAKEQGHDLNRHILWLFVHGVLHLLGYDHQNFKQEQLMKTEELAILKKSY